MRSSGLVSNVAVQFSQRLKEEPFLHRMFWNLCQKPVAHVQGVGLSLGPQSCPVVRVSVRLPAPGCFDDCSFAVQKNLYSLHHLCSRYFFRNGFEDDQIEALLHKIEIRMKHQSVSFGLALASVRDFPPASLLSRRFRT